MTKPKPKNKNYCSTCHEKHIPPTGKKCQLSKKPDMNLPSTSGAQLMSSTSDSDVPDSGVGAFHVNMSAKKVKKQKDCSVKKAVASGHSRPSNEGAETSSEEEHSSSGLQALILQQLQRVNSRLDAVEDRLGDHSHGRTGNKDSTKLSTPQCLVKSSQKSKKCNKSKVKHVVSESSSDDESLPSLSVLRSSRDIQKAVDKRLAEIESCSQVEGKDNKLKSKRGGGVEVLVSKKVAWPHDNVLGGNTRQRVTYDQLSLTQFIQGFTRNIIDETNNETREHMMWYLHDLMEDATDFTWSSAKAAHAVLLCEMERGTVSWSDTNRIDRIWRAHAQKLTQFGRQNWAKKDSDPKKP